MSTTSEITLVLGIPIDNLTLETAVERTLGLADAYRRDGRPRLIATVNVDFLTNTLAWTPSLTTRHPELLEILRRADLVTADGMPLVWLAKFLGTPLHGRVTGADLVPALARAMAKSGHSLYFLGGQGDIGQRAADKLVTQNQGLKIAGFYSPFVHTEGEMWLETEADDEKVVARINQAEPDVLLIGFGNPKQEIWFHRNRHRLKAGVSIGVGGTFEFVVGRVSRAPDWMQRSGLEWIYRITQDPRRLWKRYAVGLVKLAVMSVPLVLHYRLQRRLHRDVPAADTTPSMTTSGTTEPAQLLVTLPERTDAAWVRNQSDFSLEGVTENQCLVVDFSTARFVDSTALGYLTRLWKTAQKHNLATRSLGLAVSPAASLLKMTRTWDLFSESSLMPAPRATRDGLSLAGGLVDIEVCAEGPTLARLHGRLDADLANRLDLDGFITALGIRDCIMDLTNLQFVDSTGLRLFFHLQRHFSSHDKEMVLCSIQAPVRQLMEITRVTALFHQVPDQRAAHNYLATRRSACAVAEHDWSVSGGITNHAVRSLYKIAYRAELAVNYILRPETRGAYVAVWYTDKILLIRNSYKSSYTLPCGKVKQGEDPSDTARRELLEELGLDVPIDSFRKAYETVNLTEFKKDQIHLYEIQLETLPQVRPDGWEVTWAGFRRRTDALDLPLFPAVHHYLLHRITTTRED